MTVRVHQLIAAPWFRIPIVETLTGNSTVTGTLANSSVIAASIDCFSVPAESR
jgi:hypothetical protein